MWDWISKVSELKNSNTPFSLVTVTNTGGSSPRDTGAKMVVLSNGDFLGTIGGGNLEKQIMDQAKKSLLAGETNIFSYPLGAKSGQCCGGVVEVLIESINTGVPFYLFGAGHVGQAICKILEGTPFHIHLIDERPEWLELASMSQVTPHHNHYSEIIATIDKPEICYAAILTHSHDLDREIVNELCQKNFKYLGLIGSQNKWLRFQNQLKDFGRTDSEIDSITCPMGIDIGGKSPKEVAISLASELLSLYHGKRK